MMDQQTLLEHVKIFKLYIQSIKAKLTVWLQEVVEGKVEVKKPIVDNCLLDLVRYERSHRIFKEGCVL